MPGRGAYFNGLVAEEIAAGTYLRDGGRVLATRWKCSEGEIDLIVDLAGTLVFVEVKARRSHAAAGVAITPAQWRRLGAAAERYLAATGPVDCRFDVVLVDRAGVAERIENAWSFDAP